MSADRPAAAPGLSSAPSLEERLERGELLFHAPCPFVLPTGDDLHFLMGQRLGRWGHKNISYNPRTGRVAGFQKNSPTQAEGLRRLLAWFSAQATEWLASVLPRYARAWQLDLASLRPEEEATRRLRLTARNDLLHVDAFPTRPTHGRRILRLFVNIHPTEPRIWTTSDLFTRLLPRYGPAVGLPQPVRGAPPGSGLTSPSTARMPFVAAGASPYDRFMVRFHNFLKRNDDFQERSLRRFWTFPPGSAWLAFTDGLTHAVLRGRYALEQTYFIPTEVLALPAEAPAALLARLCGAALRGEAA
jgi:hypothetical protein